MLCKYVKVGIYWDVFFFRSISFYVYSIRKKGLKYEDELI